MTNHVHLLLTPLKADGRALWMKHLGQRHVQHVNRTCRKRPARFGKGALHSCLLAAVDAKAADAEVSEAVQKVRNQWSVPCFHAVSSRFGR
jgi:hypothetical protein